MVSLPPIPLKKMFFFMPLIFGKTRPFVLMKIPIALIWPINFLTALFNVSSLLTSGLLHFCALVGFESACFLTVSPDVTSSGAFPEPPTRSGLGLLFHVLRPPWVTPLQSAQLVIIRL